MSAPNVALSRLTTVVRAVRWRRLGAVLLLAAVLALAGDWLREERVVFPARLPAFRIVPAR